MLSLRLRDKLLKEMCILKSKPIAVFSINDIMDRMNVLKSSPNPSLKASVFVTKFLTSSDRTWGQYRVLFKRKHNIRKWLIICFACF